MTNQEIIKAWRDENFFASLSTEQKAKISHPAGEIEVTDPEIDGVLAKLFIGSSSFWGNACCSSMKIPQL